MRCRSRFGSAFGVILSALALFFGPFRFTRAFRMRSGLHFGTLRTRKSMLPSKREHRFQKISVFAIYRDFEVNIASRNRPNGAQDASVAPQERSQTPYGRFLVASGGRFGRSGVSLARFRMLRDSTHPFGTPCWIIFLMIVDRFWKNAGML